MNRLSSPFRFTTQEPGPEEAFLESLESWRERLLRRAYVVVSILGLPAVVAGSATAVRDNQLLRIPAFVGAYLLLLALTLAGSRVRYEIRGWLLVLVSLGLGFDSILSTALPGSGRIFLFASAILATVLFGLRGGLGTLLVALAGLGLGAWMVPRGLTSFSAEVMSSFDPASWATGGAVFALLVGMLVVALGVLQQGLTQALERQRDLVRRLQEERAVLERRVAERTEALARQAQQLEVTASIARLAATAPTPDELMGQAVELIRDRFGFYHASVFLLDETGYWAELVASTGEAGRQLLARRHRLAVGSASMVGWVTAHRQPRVASDVEKDPFHFKNPLLPETRSELTVPMLVGDRLIGALDVQSQQPHAFDEADVRTVEAIASELAVAIENARLMEARQAAPEDTLARAEQLRQAWEKALKAGIVARVQEGAEVGEDEASRALALQAQREGRPVTSSDGRLVAVPIRMGDQVLGTIRARRPAGAEPWSQEDLALLEAVAGQLGLALETARQYTEEQRRVVELEAINRVSQAASQLLPPESLFRIVHSQVAHALGEVDLLVALVDPVEQKVSFPYASEYGSQIALPTLNLGEGLTSLVIQSRQPILLARDVEAQARQLGARVVGAVARSWLGVPMMIGDEVLGALVVQDTEQEGRFTEDDAALLSTIAGQVATALQNARLLEQVRRTARRERLIHEIGAQIRRAPDMQSVLETATVALGRALHASRAAVELRPPEQADGDGRGS